MPYQLHLMRYGKTTEVVALDCAYDDCARAATLVRCNGRDAQLWQDGRLVDTFVPAPRKKLDNASLRPDCPYRDGRDA